VFLEGGGEEFAILLSGKDPQDTARLAKRVGSPRRGARPSARRKGF
jgi:GGDEF domain-containing protein